MLYTYFLFYFLSLSLSPSVSRFFWRKVLVLWPILIHANFPFLLYFSLCVVVGRGDRGRERNTWRQAGSMIGFGFLFIHFRLAILCAESFRDTHSFLIPLAQDSFQYVYTGASARLLTTALWQI
jgi:hypothetical protein